MTIHEVELHLAEMGIDKKDDNVQAILAAYRDRDVIAEELESSLSISPTKSQFTIDSMEVCGTRYVHVEEDVMDNGSDTANLTNASTTYCRHLDSAGFRTLASGTGELPMTEIPEQQVVSQEKNQELMAWLDSLEMGQYCELFEDYGITVHELPNLTGQTLQGMGVQNPEHRAILLRELSNFQTVDEEIEVHDVDDLTE